MIQITTNNEILLDGKSTGLALVQRAEGTVIYSYPGGYVEHKMPHPRYATSHPSPDSGAAGSLQLEDDIRALLGATS